MTETVLVELSRTNLLPSEVRLFKAGHNSSRKGTFLFDAKAAEMVMNAYAAHGVSRLPFDYEHKALSAFAAPDEQRAAGWFTLEMRDGELWATGISWNEKAADAIRNREWLYISPAFKVDDERRVTELINVALTNLPALDNQEQLVAAKAVPFKSYPPQEAGSWDASAAESRVRSWADGDMAKYREAFAWYDAERADLLGSYKLPHHDVSGGSLVTSRAGVIAAAGALSGARGGVDIPAADIAGVRSHIGRHYQQFEMTPPWEKEERMKNEILTALSLKEDTAEAEVVECVTAAKNAQTELLSITGADSVEGAMGVLRAWRAANDDSVALKERVAALEKAAIDHERASLLKANEAKFTPAELDGWVTRASIETLKAYVQTAPDRVILSQNDLPQPPAPDATKLSDEDRHVARLMSLDIETYSKNKAELENTK